MLFSPNLLILTTFIAPLSACSSDPQSQAKRAADAYIQEAYHIDPLKRPVTVTEGGRSWAVTYHVPKEYAGGDCVVSVDKQTMRVVAAICGQ